MYLYVSVVPVSAHLFLSHQFSDQVTPHHWANTVLLQGQSHCLLKHRCIYPNTPLTMTGLVLFHIAIIAPFMQ